MRINTLQQNNENTVMTGQKREAATSTYVQDRGLSDKQHSVFAGKEQLQVQMTITETRYCQGNTRADELQVVMETPNSNPDEKTEGTSERLQHRCSRGLPL